jgi:hypothetical protein
LDDTMDHSLPEPPRRPGSAAVGWWPANFGDYAEAYRAAAACLVDDVVAGRAAADAMVFPIGFLYRHALELALKDANFWVESWINGRIKFGALDARHGLSDQVIQEQVFRHQLEPLLRRLEDRLRVIADLEWLGPAVNVAVAAFHLFDSNAERFRYPFQSRGGRASFEAGLDDRVINLPHLQKALDPAIRFLTDDLRRALDTDIEGRVALERAWKSELARIELETAAAAKRLAEEDRGVRKRWTALTGRTPEEDWEEFFDWDMNNRYHHYMSEIEDDLRDLDDADEPEPSRVVELD